MIGGAADFKAEDISLGTEHVTARVRETDRKRAGHVRECVYLFALEPATYVKCEPWPRDHVDMQRFPEPESHRKT